MSFGFTQRARERDRNLTLEWAAYNKKLNATVVNIKFSDIDAVQHLNVWESQKTIGSVA